MDIGTSGYGKIYGLAFDGRYVAFITDGTAGTGLVVLDTQTGQSRAAAPLEHGRQIAGVSADRGRVVYATGVSGGPVSLYLYDAARGQTRRLTTGGRQANPEISGNLVVWDDTRNAGDSPYVYNHDVYLLDLSTGRELALASGPEWTSDPQVDGSRVVWTELHGQRWDVVGVEITPASVPLLRAEVKRMLEAGAIRNRGTARSLDGFLEQAASALAAGNRTRAAERLRQFSEMARKEAGKRIEGSAALRLQGLAAGVVAGL
jgi:beta propeller repeat protein